MAKKRRTSSVGEETSNNTESAISRTKKIKRTEDHKQATNENTNKKESSSLDKKTKKKDFPPKDTNKKQFTKDQDQKKPPKPKNNPTFIPTSTADEIDFPRGGGIQLTAYEQAEAKRDGAQEADQQLNPSELKPRSKKRTLSESKITDSGKGKGKKRAQDDQANSNHVVDAYRIEHLNHKRLIPGIKLAGMIIQIRPLELIVALPSHLVGHVPITEISPYYTQRLSENGEEDEDSDGDQSENSIKGLDEMFSVGQWIRCSVIQTTAEIHKKTLRVSPLVRTAMKVTLTMDPVHINSGIDKSDLQGGMTLTGAVKSVEDRGYIIDLGISVDPNVDSATSKVPANNLTAFVSFVDATKATGIKHDDEPSLQWEIGQIVPCRINKLSENGATCMISVNAQDISRSVLTAATSIDSILPLHMVTCLITSVIPGQGLNVSFLGFFKGTIPVRHLQCHSTTGVEVNEKFKVGQKIRARVLWDTIPSKNHISIEGNDSVLGPKIFSLSYFDHVIKLASPGLPPHLQNGELIKPDKIDELLRYPIGYVFQTVRIFRVDEDWGVYVTCLNSENGLPIEIDPPVAFAHISDISDSFLSCLSKDSGPHKIGSTHKARVTGVSPLDGVLQLTLKPSVIEQPFLRSEDIPIGALITGTVKKLTPTNLIIKIQGGSDAVVWPDHYSDVKHSHPEKKFTQGAKVKARVLYTNPEKDQVVLTLRKSLLRSEDIITSFESARVGTCNFAMVAKVEEKYMIVEFFGHTKALVPITEADVEFVASMKDLFTPGKLVKVKITRVDVEKRHITASVKLAKSEPLAKVPTVLGVGDKVLAIVSAIHQENLQLKLHRSDDESMSSDPLKGLINLDILASQYGLSPHDLKNKLKKGDQLKDLVVKKKLEDKDLLIVGYELKDQMTGVVRFINEENLVLNLRKQTQSSKTENYVEGFLPISLLARRRNISVDALKTKVSIGEVISGLRPIHHDLLRGLLIVGFRNLDSDETTEKFTFTPPKLATLSISDRVVGRVFKILEDSIILSLRKEGTEGYAECKGVIPPARVAKHRHIPEEKLRSKLKIGDYIYDLIIRTKPEGGDCYYVGFAPSEKPSTAAELSVGESVIGTVEAIHEHNVILSLQREDCENKGADVPTQGIVSSSVLAGHWNLSEKSLKHKLKEGQKIPKLVVKKADCDKGLFIVGFAPTHLPAPPPNTSLAVGETMRVCVGSRNAHGLQVTPVEASSSKTAFLIDFTDMADDYDEQPHHEAGSEVLARIVLLDKKLLKTYLSVRPSDLNKLTGETLKNSVKDRPIRQWADLRIGTTVRGFVQHISDAGLTLQVGTGIRGSVMAPELFDEETPGWKEKFRVGQVVSGKIIATQHKKLRISLKKNPGLSKGVPAWEILQVGQILSTTVRKIETYGMFLQPIQTRISGLCHRSEIYDDSEESKKKKEEWSKGYSEGMELRAAILSIDPEKKKISFTIKPSVVNPDGDESVAVESPEVIEITDHDSDDDSDDEPRHQNASLPKTSTVKAETQPPTVSIDFSEPALPISSGFDRDANKATPTANAEEEEELSTDTDDASEEQVSVPPFTYGTIEQQSVEEIEELIKESPNSSGLWNRLINLYITKADLPQARQTAKRALEAIHYREEAQKWNVWIALLRLENKYGTEEQFRKTFNEASVCNDTKTVYLKVAEIYAESDKIEKADATYSRALKKFSASSKAWTLYGEFCLKNGRPEQAQELLSRCVKSLPKHKYIKTIHKFAQLESKFGDHERARTLFEGLITQYPKRTDIWNVYVDLEIKKGTEVEVIRGLYSRMLNLNLNPKKMKSIFKKWLQFEQTRGDKESQDLVVQKAQSYVATIMSSKNSASNKHTQDADHDDENDEE
ncbi:hypothetical protein Pst134EB_019812 [Puccinia striiformis f. sp. tritici]|uniref:S1 motif domain-containing protein n=1 Tax=Puccinia striiformis f. sp. tritici PST-78 TaxID=1165861 RepID=A0A0L0UWH1_9BASI|nr:hypothetical protein Pst134EB_019812 [Puccinia striiformis f. sp. tritici]KNE91388.1 hypothetical protein PSTG_15181 [Puccinia striiformis f. sp. tritici PST-78]